MSDEKVEETPKIPTMEIAQFKLDATVILRNSDGKIAAIRGGEATVTQAYFGITLETIAAQMLEELLKKEPEPKPAPRAERRKAARQLAKELNG